MIKANEIKIVPLKDIKLNPKNRNKHPKEQIERLAQIIDYQGFRAPLIVSNRTGLIVAGHGRYEAAKLLKLKEVPVMYQDFESEEQEYAAQVSDNAIASWAELDLSGINADLPELGPDFDLDLLGIKDFTLDLSEKINNEAGLMKDQFGAPPFSVLNAREGWWQDRKKEWLAKGIKSELGRGDDLEERERE